ncbi:MAG: hypothetical protein RLZZ429_2191 [Bacteroidota bacterium]|jgi:hypothetical protein
MIKRSRRSFIANSAAITAATLTSNSLVVSLTETSPMILHQVFFWLKNSGSITDRKKLIEGLSTLKAIPTIQQLHLGNPAATEKRDVVDHSWDVSELMFFKDLKDQQAYQDHPIHKTFIKNYGHLWSRVVVYDIATIE